jgi:cellulose synthase/poly-beta-1,6-N-acetylglucosamine synthase-like glycosyltransferase
MQTGGLHLGYWNNALDCSCRIGLAILGPRLVSSMGCRWFWSDRTLLRVSVVVPTYNERGNAGEVIEQLPATGLDLQIIIVNDSGPDALEMRLKLIQEHATMIDLGRVPRILSCRLATR